MAYRRRADAVAAAHPYFVCPISHALMRDAVVAADGHSYERREIERWFEAAGAAGVRGGRVGSPLTGAEMTSAALIPNHSFRQAIQSALEVAAAAEEAAAAAAEEAVVEEAEEEAEEKEAVKAGDAAAEAASGSFGGSGEGSGGGGSGGRGGGSGASAASSAKGAWGRLRFRYLPLHAASASAASSTAAKGAWGRLRCRVLRLRRGGEGIGSGSASASAASSPAQGAWGRLRCLVLRLRPGGGGIGSGTRGAGGGARAAESREEVAAAAWEEAAGEVALRELAARVEAEVGAYLDHGWRQGLPLLTSTLTAKARPRALACGSPHGGQGGSMVPPHTR